MTVRGGVTGAVALALALALMSCSPDSTRVSEAEEIVTPSPSPSPVPSPVSTVRGRFRSKHSPKPPSPPPPPPAVVASPAPVPSTQTGIWLAVLATERDPNKLDADLKKLRKRYGRSVMTGQVFCYPEVGEGRNLRDDSYILAFITGSLAAAEALVAESGYPAEFYERVTDRCGG